MGAPDRDGGSTSPTDERTAAEPAVPDAIAVPLAEEPTGIPPQLIIERMLLTALREQDAADAATAAQRRAEFLVEASLRLGASLDEELTYTAIAGLTLPELHSWCIVDVIEVGGGLRRLGVIHPDQEMHDVGRTLSKKWKPSADDPIGVPVVARERLPVIVTERVEDVVSAAARDPETLRILQRLGAGSLLVVPIVDHDSLLGAITFVSRPGASAYTEHDVTLAESLAERCAQALVSARLYAAARALWSEADAARSMAETAREEAEAANAAKAQFLGTMSHELRTPLNAIGGYADLMTLGIYGQVTAEQVNALERIGRNQQHLLRLINEVLDFAKVGAGVVSYEIADVPIGEVLTSCETLIAPQARAKRLALTVEPCDPQLTARADRGKLQQVVLNLLINAIQFTEPGGSVTLTAFAPPDSVDGDKWVSIAVKDSGRGIAADQIERAFQPFVQIDAALTRSNQGTGLGLAIGREFSRGMGGDLTVESSPGAGSTFTLMIPRA